MQSLFIQLPDYVNISTAEKMTLMTYFVAQGHIISRRMFQMMTLTFHDHSDFNDGHLSGDVWRILHVAAERPVVLELHLDHTDRHILLVHVSGPFHTRLKLRQRTWKRLPTGVIEELWRKNIRDDHMLTDIIHEHQCSGDEGLLLKWAVLFLPPEGKTTPLMLNYWPPL